MVYLTFFFFIPAQDLNEHYLFNITLPFEVMALLEPEQATLEQIVPHIREETAIAGAAAKALPKEATGE